MCHNHNSHNDSRLGRLPSDLPGEDQQTSPHILHTALLVPGGNLHRVGGTPGGERQPSPSPVYRLFLQMEDHRNKEGNASLHFKYSRVLYKLRDTGYTLVRLREDDLPRITKTGQMRFHHKKQNNHFDIFDDSTHNSGTDARRMTRMTPEFPEAGKSVIKVVSVAVPQPGTQFPVLLLTTITAWIY